MKNKALLVYGKSNPSEDNFHFERFIGTNIQVMSNIAVVSGYSPKVISLSELDPKFEDYKMEDDFLFYYTGHSEGVFLGSLYLNEVVNSIEKIKGKKTIILDTCTDVFVSKHHPNKNTTIAGSFDVYYDRPLAMSLYDAVIARGKKLDSLTQETFNEMKHNWVMIKKN